MTPAFQLCARSPSPRVAVDQPLGVGEAALEQRDQRRGAPPTSQSCDGCRSSAASSAIASSVVLRRVDVAELEQRVEAFLVPVEDALAVARPRRDLDELGRELELPRACARASGGR